ncbi:bifunctional sugar phosphate isomerase/epimerase/4-hydroxyphenylpyruvate dioxygenase family protein [Homoserinimonas sp. A447]
MRTSIATVCLSGKLEEKLHACAEAGFAGVEIFEQDLLVSPHSPEQIRDLAARLGLSLDLFQPIRDVEGVEPEVFAENLRRVEAKFVLMNRLGIDLALMCTNVATATIDDDEVVADQLRQLGDLAERYAVRVAMESLAWGRFISDFEHVQRVVGLADHPAVGQCLDTFHVISRDWALEPLENLPVDKIFFVQLADAPRLSLDVLSWSRHYRVFPGQGDMDVPAFLGYIARTGYDGPVSLEIFNDTFRQADPFRTAVDGMRSLVWLQEQTALWLAGRPGTAPRMELAPLVQVEEPSGYNFVEVRADDSHRLRDVLATLGFRSQGKHRNKPVELWEHGGARIIVNEQPTSRTEPAIAALGFDVPDPVRAASRALQLRASSVPRSQQIGEEVLQAVSAPDSTEIFFSRVDSEGVPPWAVEFGDGERVTGTDDLITHIDHVNLAQPWQHFDEAVLFYQSILGLHPQPSLDVPAPVGLVRSQSMSTTDAAVRLALNIVPALSGDDDGTIYPQHVAFLCRDIVALAERAVERGLEFLPIPPNYYEDLAARFILSPEFLAELERLHLLYDRDEHGEFLHFYTGAVGRVFLEVVERRTGYAGYGAPNAPVRLAAQHRLLEAK